MRDNNSLFLSFRLENPRNPRDPKETARFRMQMVVVVAGEALAHHNLNRGNVRLNFYRRFIEAAASVEDLKIAKDAVFNDKKRQENEQNAQRVALLIDDIIDYFGKHGDDMSEEGKTTAIRHFESIINDHRATGVIPLPVIGINERRNETQRMVAAVLPSSTAKIPPHAPQTTARMQPHSPQSTARMPVHSPNAPTISGEYESPRTSRVHRRFMQRVQTQIGIAPEAPAAGLPLPQLLRTAQAQLAVFKFLLDLIRQLQTVREDLSAIGANVPALTSNLEESIDLMKTEIEKQLSFPRSMLLWFNAMKKISMEGTLGDLESKRALITPSIRAEAQDTSRFFHNFGRSIQRLIDEASRKPDLPADVQQQVEEIIQTQPLLRLVSSR